MPRRVITTTFLGLSGFVVPLTGMAAEPKARSNQTPNAAQKAYARAKAAYDTDRYEECKQILRDTGSLTPVSLVLLAQAECELKEYRECATHAQEALRSPQHKPDKRRLIMEVLAGATQEVGSLTLTVNVPGANVFIDGETVGTTPIEHPTYLRVGTRKVTVVRTGYRSVTREIEATRGVTLPLVLDLQEQPAQAPTTDPRAHVSTIESSRVSTPPNSHPLLELPRDMGNGPSVVPLIAGSALTVGAVVAGLYFNSKAHSEYNQATELQSKLEPYSCMSPHASVQADCSSLQMHLKSGDNARNFSTAAWIVGGVTLTGTATYFLWPRGTTSANRRPFRVNGAIGPNDGWLRITTAF